MTTPVVLVAALDRRGAIGRGGTLPWHLPDDLRRFKALTAGGTLLMGRRTAESLRRALPGRRNLVLTRSGRVPYAGMEPIDGIGDALAAAARAGGDLFVIGGAEVYALTLPMASRLHLTHVDTVVPDADTWFPAWRTADWRVEREEAHPADERHAAAFRFVDYGRPAPDPRRDRV